MGRWAQRQKRGGSVAAALPVPVLTDAGGATVTYTVDGPTPDQAWFDFSATGLEPWFHDSTTPWDGGPYSPAGSPGFFRMHGLDALGATITGNSNVVELV